MTSSERTEIEATVTRYFEGMRDADVDTLASAFRDDAGFYGFVGDELYAGPIAHLYDWVVANLTPGASGPDFKLEFQSVEQHGPIASVTCRELGFVGHDLLEYFTLLKANGSWKITSKLFAAL